MGHEKEFLMETMLSIKKEIDKLQAEYDEIKQGLFERMQKDELGFFSVTDLGAVRYIEPTETKTVNLVALEEREPELYKELMEDYPKTTKRSGYYTITWDKRANARKTV